MAAVVRLVTVVDIHEGNFPMPVVENEMLDRQLREDAVPAVAPARTRPAPDYDRMQGFSALHLAVLNDGRRLTLLDDRGWGSVGPAGIWSRTSIEEIEQTARAVVGPDEDDPEFEAAHWERLASVLQQHGVDASADQLSRLPHDVEITTQVRNRIAGA